MDKYRPRSNWLFLLALLLLGLLFGQAQTSQAQLSNNSTYWQFSGVGELDHVWVADVNQDGIDEFVIVAGQTRLSLLGSNGQPIWEAPIQADQPILHLRSGPLRPGTSVDHSLIIADGADLYALSLDGVEEWRISLPDNPARIELLPAGENEPWLIVAAFATGQLRAYGQNGQEIWSVPAGRPPLEASGPILTVGDFRQAGVPSLAFSYWTTQNQSELRFVSADGSHQNILLDHAISALAAADFARAEPDKLAIGTRDGALILLDVNRRRWHRTPFIDHEITSLAIMQHLSERYLIVGNDASAVVAYDQLGRRKWLAQLTGNAASRVIRISANPVPTAIRQSFGLAVSIGNIDNRDTQVILLDRNGQRLPDTYTSTSSKGLSRLLDVNADSRPELFLVRFSTGTLFDPGIGAGENLIDWNYDISADPRAALVVDVDGDAQDELLIGARDGRLHLVDNDGDNRWVQNFPGDISFIEYLPFGVDGLPTIIAVHNQTDIESDGSETIVGALNVLQASGVPFAAWSLAPSTETAITSLLVHDVNGDGEPEIAIGTRSGEIITYSLDQRTIWQANVENGVEFLVGLENAGNGRASMMAGNQTQELRLLSNKGAQSIPVTYFQDIVDIRPLETSGNLRTRLAVAIEDGGIRGLDDFGRALWQFDLQADPLFALGATSNSLVVATDNDELVRLATNIDETNASELWRLTDLGRISAVYWGDLDGDEIDDVAIGNREGGIKIFTSDGATQWEELSLASEIAFIRAMRRATNAPPELAVVTTNGFVTYFRAQANRPPLLVNPLETVNAGQYSIAVEVINVEENDRVQVTLEVFDRSTGLWRENGTQTARSNVALFWQLDPAVLDPAGVRYRFHYNDGPNEGYVQPTLGPVPSVIESGPNYLPATILLGLLVIIGSILFIRQTRTLEARVARFYKRLQRRPTLTMELLDVAYNVSGGSPDYLLNLSSRARADNSRLVASLADGLYLLADRPGAALEIIESALMDADAAKRDWHQRSEWLDFITAANALYQAPTITEISLLRPQYMQLIHEREEPLHPGASIHALKEPITNLRDSERVELFEDRFVYLNEATGHLRELREKLSWYPTSIESDIVLALTERWIGLIEAEIEGLRGQANLTVGLSTQRIIPGDEATVVLELTNKGRAPAERVVVDLLPDPSYEVLRQPETIALLPAGRTRQATAILKPLAEDRFRLSAHITYSDRAERERTIPFGDLVHVLSPMVDFKPVVNPYAPGTPLRRNSELFYGREDIFEFISETASRRDQQHVLILVGQRRTGKTSTLLRLGKHLPDDLVPVYIDCQSLGVVEGMAALFHDIAWLISDALVERGIDLAVPEMNVWDANPTNYFQRQFIPQALALLMDEARLLLVFDEFEAFEDLVEKGILPSTMFTYLRHLMQHGEGLSFVFVGTRRLEEMTTSYWSVLFNIALYKEIGFLNPAAATKLITEPVLPNILYDDLALDKIMRVTAGHPYFLQLVCYTLVNRANKAGSGYITITDVNAAIDEMLRLGEVHFAYIWQLSSHTERAILTSIAHHIDPDAPFHPIDLVQYLDRFGIRLNPTEVTAGLETLVEREILEEVNAEGTSLYTLKIGLVGLWTAQNKSLSKLYDLGSTAVERRPTRPERP